MFERAHALIPAYGGEDSPAARLAALYRDRHDDVRAAEMLKVVVAADESAYQANTDLAALLLAQRDTSGAMDAMERAVYINPFLADLHGALASLAAARGDHVRRVREREALVALDPVDRAEALYQLALAHRDAGDLVKAKSAVLRALEDAPNFGKAQDLLLALVDGRKP